VPTHDSAQVRHREQFWINKLNTLHHGLNLRRAFAAHRQHGQPVELNVAVAPEGRLFGQREYDRKKLAQLINYCRQRGTLSVEDFKDYGDLKIIKYIEMLHPVQAGSIEAQLLDILQQVALIRA